MNVNDMKTVFLIRSKQVVTACSFVLLATIFGCNKADGKDPASSNQESSVSAEAFANSMDSFLKTETGREKIAKAVEKYFTEARERAQKDAENQAKAEVDKYFANPMEAPIGASPVKGIAEAPITIVEFSDFECPYCQRGAAVVEQLLNEYSGKVKVAFKNLPLPFHKNARPAAKAALAAGKQGKFWEFHDALFNNQRKLGDELYLEIAKNLKLDISKFDKDRASDEIEAEVAADEQLAGNLGFQGTPGFVVGGIPVRGAYPLEHFKDIISKLLAKTQ